jgi:hypothetical protein
MLVNYDIATNRVQLISRLQSGGTHDQRKSNTKLLVIAKVDKITANSSVVPTAWVIYASICNLTVRSECKDVVNCCGMVIPVVRCSLSISLV